jgi:hypothetical protein
MSCTECRHGITIVIICPRLRLVIIKPGKVNAPVTLVAALNTKSTEFSAVYVDPATIAVYIFCSFVGAVAQAEIPAIVAV